MLYRIKYYLHSPTTSYQKIITQTRRSSAAPLLRRMKNAGFCLLQLAIFPKTSSYFIHTDPI